MCRQVELHEKKMRKGNCPRLEFYRATFVGKRFIYSIRAKGAGVIVASQFINLDLSAQHVSSTSSFR